MALAIEALQTDDGPDLHVYLGDSPVECEASAFDLATARHCRDLVRPLLVAFGAADLT